MSEAGLAKPLPPCQQIAMSDLLSVQKPSLLLRKKPFSGSGQDVRHPPQPGIQGKMPRASGSIFSLAAVRADILEHCERLRDPEAPFGSYRDSLQGRSDLYSACDVALIMAIMGENPLETLAQAERAEWAGHINSFATSDGSYTDRMGQSALHANGMVIGALGVLGEKMVNPVRHYAAFERPETVGPWLDSLDWQCAWPQSHAFWGGIHCFSMSGRASAEWLSAVFGWLDSNIDRKTGWWRALTPHSDRNQGLGAAAHLFPLYEHHDRRFPEPERVIDSVLEMQLPEGCWLEEIHRQDPVHVMNYLELDALYALVLMQKYAPGYRRQDILESVRHFGNLVREYYRNYRTPLLSLHPHYILAAVGTFGLLQQLLPNEFIDDRAWSDIFSDRRFYRTEEVEAHPANRIKAVHPTRGKNLYK